jgi:hypothetical protein
MDSRTVSTLSDNEGMQLILDANRITESQGKGGVIFVLEIRQHFVSCAQSLLLFEFKIFNSCATFSIDILIDRTRKSIKPPVFLRCGKGEKSVIARGMNVECGVEGTRCFF